MAFWLRVLPEVCPHLFDIHALLAEKRLSLVVIRCTVRRVLLQVLAACVKLVSR